MHYLHTSLCIEISCLFNAGSNIDFLQEHTRFNMPMCPRV